MGHYRIYEMDPADRIRAGYSIECCSDAVAKRAARTLLQCSAGIELWNSNRRVAHLGMEAKRLWPQLRNHWIGYC